MQQETIDKLNEINRSFYIQTAKAFDDTRQRPWPGWERILPYIQKRPTLRILDIGCGNGRFGVFLGEKFGGSLFYHGIDNNRPLLDLAEAALDTEQVQLEERDVVASPPDLGKYDLVAAFGLLHHIPGNDQRLQFMESIAGCVGPGGFLAFACWRFLDSPRLQKKIAPWPSELEQEPGDYLLDWRRDTVALRYCHYVDDAEHERLVQATGLEQVASYRADGHDQMLNQYTLVRH